MSSRRSSCGVATMDSLLYCVGGNDGTMCLGKMQCQVEGQDYSSKSRI